MNVLPRSPMDAATSRGAGTATARPAAAGGDAGFAFEQALKARGDALCIGARPPPESGTDGEEQESADVEPPPRQDGSIMLAAPTTVALGPVAASGNGTSGPQTQDAGPTRTALAMALGMPAFPVDAVTAGQWEVSIPTASGAALKLLAGRAPMADGSAAWTLDIRSRARDIQGAMARSASRLSDRLEARAISARVRVEDDEDDEDEAP